MRKLTHKELSLWAVALNNAKEYDDANPDVGMGPSEEMLLEDVERATGQSLSKEQRKMVIAEARRIRVDPRTQFCSPPAGW